jgi:hypothetical protein
MKRYWQITIHDGLKPTYEIDVPARRLSSDQLQGLIRALASRYLTEDEVVASMLNRYKGPPERRDLLDVRKENDNKRRRTNYFCGLNPHVAAVIIQK